MPLLIGHFVDWCVLWRPDAVVSNENVQTSKAIYDGGDEPAHILSAAQIRGNGNTSIFAAFLRKFVGLGF